MYAIVSSSS